MPLIADAMRASPACAVVIGPGGLGDSPREELVLAGERAVKDNDFRLFMVVLSASPEPLDPQLTFVNSRTC